MTSGFRFFSFLVCFALMGARLEAQDATGRVIGMVTDPSGSVVPGARITVTNVDTGIKRETAAADDGTYQALLLPVGRYRVTVEARGFRKVVTDPQQLDINQSLRIDLKLEVGAATETVQVEALTSTAWPSLVKSIRPS